MWEHRELYSLLLPMITEEDKQINGKVSEAELLTIDKPNEGVE